MNQLTSVAGPKLLVTAAVLVQVASLRVCPCRAESAPAAVQWSFDAADPVIKPGQIHGKLDSKRAAAGHVIQVGDHYHMYYWGTGADGYGRILLARSSVHSPNQWEPLGSVLERQPDKEYNCVGPGFPFVVPRDDGPWLMYFCGWGAKRPDHKLPNTTGLALSDDQGRTWQYWKDNPMIPLDQPYDREATGSACVLNDGGSFRMYYTSIGRYYQRPKGVKTGHGEILPEIGIGYATSQDGIHWTKPFDHLLISPRRFEAEGYEYICSKPFVINEDDRYRMWFHTFGTAYRIRSLTSRDGLHWTRNESGPAGELGVGPKGAFDDVQRSYICVVRYQDEYRCWYTGNRFGATGMGYATAKAPPSSRPVH